MAPIARKVVCSAAASPPRHRRLSGMEAGIARMREENNLPRDHHRRDRGRGRDPCLSSSPICAPAAAACRAMRSRRGCPVDGLGVGTDVRLSGIKIGIGVGPDARSQELPCHSAHEYPRRHQDSDRFLADGDVIGLLGSSYLSLTPGGSDKMLAAGRHDPERPGLGGSDGPGRPLHRRRWWCRAKAQPKPQAAAKAASPLIRRATRLIMFRSARD